MPAELKRQQAKRFNSGDGGLDYILATDAIGMGMNLKIKRVLFWGVDKRNGSQGSNRVDKFYIR